MTRDEAIALVPSSAAEEDESTFLPSEALRFLTVADLPERIPISVSDLIDDVHRIEWDGHFFRSGDELRAHCRYTWTRAYWDSAIGMPLYLDLVKRSIETRQRLKRDVSFLTWDDDGKFINMAFELHALPAPLHLANDYVVSSLKAFQEAAEEAAERSGVIAAEIAQRVSGWGSTPLQKLVEIVDGAKTSDEKGRSLEELVARIFSSMSGMKVTGRIRTETEEIDITVVNGSDVHLFRREEALILIECKNWSSKCGKNEFVIFKEKVENRKGRCSLGFLVSWNGFADTVTKEMLRGSREKTLIVPLSGRQIRDGVRSDDCLTAIIKAWTDAVNT